MQNAASRYWVSFNFKLTRYPQVMYFLVPDSPTIAYCDVIPNRVEDSVRNLICPDIRLPPIIGSRERPRDPSRSHF
jgi:hypothetical protein